MRRRELRKRVTMKTARIVVVALGGIAAGAIGCGGGSDIECGPGTVEENGVCVPTGTTECGPGTVLMGDQCVPDGSVICEQGTVFDPTSGRCVVDPSACAAGTVLVDGECVPEDDTLADQADFQEGPEPNDGQTGIAGMFDAPALDASTTIYGCITPTEDADGDGNLDADLDAWLVTASGPMVLEITADGIRGLSAGFIAVNADAALSPVLDNWQRIGINLAGDTSQRQIFLPAAGTYGLFMADSRPLFLGGAGAGDQDTCYFTTIRHVATPAASALALPQHPGTHDGNVQVFTHTADEGDILDVTLNTTSAAMSPAFILQRAGSFVSAAPQADLFGTIPPFTTAGGLAADETLTLVVDPEYNYGISPQAFSFDGFDIAGQAFPVTGTQITVTENNGTTGAGYPDLNYLYFDVATAGVKHFAVTASVAVDMVIVRRDIFTPTGAFDYIAQINAFGGTGQTAFTNEFVRFLSPGRYYFVTQNPAATMAGGTYTVTATVTDVTPTPLTLGTEVTNQALPLTSGFHSLDLTNPIWLEFGITATANWGTGTASIEAYDNAAGGWLRSGTAPGTLPPGHLYPAFAGSQPSAAPFAPMPRILANDTRDFLLRVKPNGTPGTGPTYSLLVQDRPNVTNLGMLAPGTPTPSTVMTLAPGAPARFIVLGAAGNAVRSLNHPTNALSDILVRRLTASEGSAQTFNAGGLGADETLTTSIPAAPNNWVAWQVENTTVATTTNVDVTTTVIQPTPYTITAGTLAFVDACMGTGAVVLGTNQDDQMFTGQTLPAAFSGFLLFGDPLPANHRVGANGWISWDTGSVSFGAYQNRMMPLAGPPDGVIAPFWQDFDTITLCRKDDAVANTVTYQWSGNIYQTPSTQVQFQLVLHANGVIDFIYGPGHEADGLFADSDGNGASVGAENLGGTFGHQIVFNQALIAPNTSRTLTPM
jgi:hypothetical protein